MLPLHLRKLTRNFTLAAMVTVLMAGGEHRLFAQLPETNIVLSTMINCWSERPGFKEISAEHGGGLIWHDSFTEFNQQKFAQLTQAPRLRSIAMSGPLPNGGWRLLQQMPELESLTVNSHITNDHLQHLGVPKHLKSLQLNNTYKLTDKEKATAQEYLKESLPFSAVSLGFLKSLPQLRHLSLNSSFLADDGMENLAHAPTLVSLNLHGDFTSETLKHIGQLTELRRLRLHGQFDDQGLEYLASLRKLESLEIVSPKLQGSGLAHLAEIPELKYLLIYDSYRDVSGIPFSLAELKNWPALEVLNLGVYDSSHKTLATLPVLPKLKSLTLGHHSVADDNVQYLANLPALEELNLNTTKITDRGLQELASFPRLQQNLRALKISDRHGARDASNFTLNGLKNLRQFSNLEELALYNMPLTLEGFAEIPLPNLQKIYLNSNHGLDRGDESLRQKLLKYYPRLAPAHERAPDRISGGFKVKADAFVQAPGLTEYNPFTDSFKVEL